jgi:hypothetical protein
MQYVGTCIPSLSFNSFAINDYAFYSKLDTDGRFSLFKEFALCKTRQQIALADATVADQHN